MPDTIPSPQLSQPAAELPTTTTAQQSKPTISKKKHRFVSWLHRHHITFLLFAGILVFVTFIVRDALRDHLRELVDSIDRNQATFSHYVEMLDLDKQLKDIDAKLDAFKYGENQDKRTVALDNTTLLQQQLIDETSLVENVWELVAELPDSSEKARIAKTYANLTSQLYELLEGTSNAQAELIAQAWQGANIDVGTINRANAVIADREIDVRTKISAYEDDAFQEAVKLRDKRKFRYAFATHLSYLLYAGVILVGLIGRLVGIEAGAGE